MKSLEREIREYLTRKGVQFEDHGSDYGTPDFKVFGADATAWVEVKEKRQVYSADKWPLGDVPETSAFILDELTARKLFKFGVTSCIIIRDNTTGLYYFADPLSLFLMSRTRCVRDHNGFPKAKWVVDLRNFYGSDRLHDMFVFMRDWMNEFDDITGRNAGIFRNDFIDEEIKEAGTPRTEEQKAHDVKTTR